MPHYDIDVLKSTKAPDLLSLAQELTTLKRAASSHGGEWAGPCPFCGIAKENGFVVQPYHKPEARWLCRKCTNGVWKDVINFIERRDNVNFLDACKALWGENVKLAPEDLEEIRRRRDEVARLQEEEDRSKIEQARAELNASNAWEEYYRYMVDNDLRDMWVKRGLSPMWQDYFRVGVNPDREFTSGKKESFHSPSITIPAFRTIHKSMGPMQGVELERYAVQLSHRLLIENPPGGKYRPHIYGCGKPLFFADYEHPLVGEVLLVEGEIKAAVTWAYLQDWAYRHSHLTHPLKSLQVVGTMGQNLKLENPEEFANVERIYIAFDPDVWKRPENALKDWLPTPLRAALELGHERCFIIRLPGKIDDLLTDETIEIEDIYGLMKTARPVIVRKGVSKK